MTNVAREAAEDREAQVAADFRPHSEAIAIAAQIEYENACAGQPSQTVAEAIATIAAFFYDPNAATFSNRENEAVNALRFQQRGALGNMCQNASWMLGNAQAHTEKLIAEIDQLEATSDGGDISMSKLDNALNRYEDARNSQIPACKEWLATLKIAYETIVGEPWVPFAKKGPAAPKQTADAIRARLAAFREG